MGEIACILNEFSSHSENVQQQIFTALKWDITQGEQVMAEGPVLLNLRISYLNKEIVRMIIIVQVVFELTTVMEPAHHGRNRCKLVWSCDPHDFATIFAVVVKQTNDSLWVWFASFWQNCRNMQSCDCRRLQTVTNVAWLLRAQSVIMWLWAGPLHLQIWVFSR